MLKTRVDRIPAELYDMAKARSKEIGQSKTQAYRDIVNVARNIDGLLNTPAGQIKKDEKNKGWIFKI